MRVLSLVLLFALLSGLSRAGAQAAPPLGRELVRIGLYGGAGYANEHASDGMYGAGVLQVAAYPMRHLLVGLNVELLSNYDRTYSTRLPSLEEDEELLRFSTSEKMRRGRLLVGFETLHLALRDADGVQLLPYAFGELLAFNNEVWPQRHGLLGAGIACEVRVHDALRILADVSYGAVVGRSGREIDEHLLYGALAGTFRMSAGAAFAIHPRARFELRYLGELLQYGHATRVLDTLLFGPVFHLR